MNCFLTGDKSEFSKYVDPSKLPGLFGDEFSVNFSDASTDMLFLIKKSTDFSVLEALASEKLFDAGTADSDIKALRDICANEARRAERLSDALGNTAYKSLLSCIYDQAMTGILIFSPSVTVKKKENMGPEEITKSLDYILPFVQISNVSFDGDQPDISQAVSCGAVFLKGQPGVLTDAYESFSLSIQESFASFRQGKLYMPQLVFGLVCYRLFEQKVLSETTLQFLGSYLSTDAGAGDKSAVFGFRLVRGVRLFLDFRAMPCVLINSGSAELKGGDDVRLKLSLNGSLMFVPESADYDYFSFDELHFSGMKADFMISGGNKPMKCYYRDMQLDEGKSRLRSGSFLDMAPHGKLSLICFQDGNTPADLGFSQMNAGCVQQAIQEEKWFGLSVPVELFHGIQLTLLFAFEARLFYAGVMLGGRTSVTLSSLLNVRWNEMQVQKTDSGYALSFRGLKICCFGKAFPEGSANMLLVPGGDGGSLAWYALYDNRNEEGKDE